MGWVQQLLLLINAWHFSCLTSVRPYFRVITNKLVTLLSQLLLSAFCHHVHKGFCLLLFSTVSIFTKKLLSGGTILNGLTIFWLEFQLTPPLAKLFDKISDLLQKVDSKIWVSSMLSIIRLHLTVGRIGPSTITKIRNLATKYGSLFAVPLM